MTYQFFKENPSFKLKVNDKKYDNIVGNPTESGFYKNGWEVKELEGKKGKYNYIALSFYTSAGLEVDIEERWMIRDDNKIIIRKGWHGVDLLKMAMDGENEADLKIYMDRFKKEKNEEEEVINYGKKCGHEHEKERDLAAGGCWSCEMED